MEEPVPIFLFDSFVTYKIKFRGLTMLKLSENNDEVLPMTLNINEIDRQYIIKQKIFEALNFSVYIVTLKQEGSFYELLLIKDFNSEGPSAHIWHKKFCKNSTIIEIVNEVAEAIQSGFIKDQ
jgi:hypothetical protein